MRSKEDAHDYRYFPDPDLPPLVIAAEWVEHVRAAMPELPSMMTQSLAFARTYEAVRDACGQPKLAANWLMGEVSKRLNAGGIGVEAMPITAAQLAALIRRVADGTVSHNGARQVFDALWQAEGDDVDTLIETRGLRQMNDSGALEAIVAEVVAANAKSVGEYRSGKDKAFNALVGQVMKASKGKANPQQAAELLKKALDA
jgi:aspartyl-tRNA(Asn)/glutamyl-tRNA(Gln) amidotransferase subunit B